MRGSASFGRGRCVAAAALWCTLFGMPMTDAWLDVGTKPYRMHLRAAVVHGSPILIEVDEVTRRLTIHPQNDPAAVIISGLYMIDPTPIPGAPLMSSP